MTRNPWVEYYISAAVGYLKQGICAACEYQGPTVNFVVWERGFKAKTLCNGCSGDVEGTMQHEGWTRVAGAARGDC